MHQSRLRQCEQAKREAAALVQMQAADRPQALKIQGADNAQGSEELTVNGKVDLGALVMVIAGSVAGGP